MPNFNEIMTKKKEPVFEVIVRKKAAYRSRQWWLNKAIKIRNVLLKSRLLRRQLSLIKSSTTCILITSDQEIKKLNKKFRNKNKTTDVLSFHLKTNEQHKFYYLGDIIISLDTAKRNAKANKITPEQELVTLLAHGYLHLLGYDHQTKKDAKIMFKLQNNILKELGFNNIVIYLEGL